MNAKNFLIAHKGEVQVYVAKCGHINTNTGFIENTALKEAILVDAPFGAHKISQKILPAETKVIAVMFTHGHWDHIGDAHIFKQLNATTYAHKLEKLFLERPTLMSLFASIDESFTPCTIDVEIQNDEIITINEWAKISCKWVPGHTQGGLVFYFETMNCVFTGDTLFKDCIGRSDLPGGNESLLITNIKEKLLTLPNETIIIPGHGNLSTIGKEKRDNEFLT